MQGKSKHGRKKYVNYLFFPHHLQGFLLDACFCSVCVLMFYKFYSTGVLLFDTSAWYVHMPKEIHGFKGSCLVIPCSFYYTSYPPENPSRIVWYQWVSKGYPLVYDPWYPNDVIGKFRGTTDLYGEPSRRDCSLLIKNLELSHHGEKLYTWIDPENVGWRTYKFYDVTSTIVVDSM